MHFSPDENAELLGLATFRIYLPTVSYDAGTGLGLPLDLRLCVSLTSQV